MDKDHEAIQWVRDQFKQEVETNPDLYDPIDVKRIQESEFYVQRFINFLNQGPEKGFDQLKESFQWRKSFKLNDFDPLDYNKEWYEAGAIFPFLPDSDGVQAIHLRPKLCAKFKKENSDKFEKYSLQVVHQVDSIVQQEFGWGLVMNCSDISVKDVDLDFLFHILPKLRKYFPNGCKYCIIYGLHWSVNYICKVALAAMPADSAKKIRFLGKESELIQVIPQSRLPDYLNGTAKINYHTFPDSKYIHGLAHYSDWNDFSFQFFIQFLICWIFSTWFIHSFRQLIIFDTQ